MRRLLIIIAACFSLVLAFIVGRASISAPPKLAGVAQENTILAKVGKLIPLPTNETPTIAMVRDAASAKQDQPFLAPAENGDVLIVYTNAQEAILYRPSSDKIIVVGPVHDTVPVPSSVSSTASSTYVATTTKPKR